MDKINPAFRIVRVMVPPYHGKNVVQPLFDAPYPMTGLPDDFPARFQVRDCRRDPLVHIKALSRKNGRQVPECMTKIVVIVTHVRT